VGEYEPLNRENFRYKPTELGMPDETTISYCHECKRPLTEIENRGQLLKGCMTCNIWWSSSGDKVRLSEEDLRSLHLLRRKPACR
jgi:hypothetical protein